MIDVRMLLIYIIRKGMLKSLLCMTLVLLLYNDITSAQQKRIYLAPDDHTDYMWSGDEEMYKNAFLKMLDYYISLNDSTKYEPYPYQSKWNCDGSFWVYVYEKNRDKIQFLKLIDQVRNGKITVPLNTLSTVHGIAPAEATIRSMYYAGSLERRFGLDLDIALNIEDQVLPLGLSSLWAGSGARYSWRGVCACATKVRGFNKRPNEIYWYKGLDDQKILMKWYSLNGNNMRLGGYAEARNIPVSVRLCNDLMNKPGYPYSISGAFGMGWDDLFTTSSHFLKAAKDLSDPSTQVIISNEVDFFRDFEENYGSSLPSESVSYGSTEWGNSVASLAEVSASVKRSIEKLRAAEAMYTFVVLKDREFGKNLENMREQAWIACGLYFEHDWTSDGQIISRKQRAAWQRKIAGQLALYVDTLYNLSVKRLGELVKKPENSADAFFVFNPLSWERKDYADYSYQGPSAIQVIDMITGEPVPFQPIIKNGKKYLRIMARGIPSLGFKTYIIKKGSPERQPDFVNISGSVIENDYYKIIFNDRGIITSLKDKRNNNFEYIDHIRNLYANDPGSSGSGAKGRIRIENMGPVSSTLVAECSDPFKHVSKLTMFKDLDRIELENYITQNIEAGPLTYTFSFNLNNPEIWHEEAGSILKARQKSDGGHYADSICRLDWLAMNHFADISDGNHGMIVSNRDAFFMKTGNSTIEKLDTSLPQISVLAAGQIDAPKLGLIDQDGDSYFETFFALKTNSNGFNAPSDMKFSLEHQNPLIAGKVTGVMPDYGMEFSLFNVSDPDVIVWSVKPAEEGIHEGIILRLWNLGEADSLCSIASDLSIKKYRTVTHIEKNMTNLFNVDSVLSIKAGHNRIHSYRVFLE